MIHHTGTIIRFRPRALSLLPPTDAEILIELPTGRIVNGHFNRNVRNPNISGPEIVRFIKRRLAFSDTEPALIESRSTAPWRLLELTETLAVTQAAGVSNSRVSQGRLTRGDLARLMRLADQHDEASVRRAAYARILRPQALRRLALSVLGTDCQVDGCSAVHDIERDWGPGSSEAIVDVHHIEAVSRRVDHHPANLCVLCANHHALIHRRGSWDIIHDGDNVILTSDDGSLTIRRDPAESGVARGS